MNLAIYFIKMDYFPDFRLPVKRSLSSLLRLSAVLITVKGNSAPHQCLERQALAISLKIKFMGLCIHTKNVAMLRFFL